MKLKRTDHGWAVKWRSKNILDGITEHFVGYQGGRVCMFATRNEARDFITENYGYIRNRPDLRDEPHGWKMPIPVKVEVTTMEWP